VFDLFEVDQSAVNRVDFLRYLLHHVLDQGGKFLVRHFITYQVVIRLFKVFTVTLKAARFVRIRLPNYLVGLELHL
jgi:hypothetical protein